MKEMKPRETIGVGSSVHLLSLSNQGGQGPKANQNQAKRTVEGAEKQTTPTLTL
jgi:hypothetical protein